MVRKSGMEIWFKINRLRSIYQLHPLDAVAMQCTVLNSSEANRVRHAVEAKVIGCRQKDNEAADGFAQKFAKTFLRHSGMSGLTEEDIGMSSNDAQIY